VIWLSHLSMISNETWAYYMCETRVC